MRDGIEDIFRSDLEESKNYTKLKIDRQKRQSMMESGKRLKG